MLNAAWNLDLLVQLVRRLNGSYSPPSTSSQLHVQQLKVAQGCRQGRPCPLLPGPGSQRDQLSQAPQHLGRIEVYESCVQRQLSKGREGRQGGKPQA